MCGALRGGKIVNTPIKEYKYVRGGVLLTSDRGLLRARIKLFYKLSNE